MIVRMFDKPDYIQLAMHRILSASVLSKKVGVNDFNLKKYLKSGAMGFSFGKDIKLKAKFYNYAGLNLAETPLTSDQELKEIDKKTHQLVAKVNNNQELRWWLQGFGANVEVISPKSVRDEIKKSLADALARY